LVNYTPRAIHEKKIRKDKSENIPNPTASPLFYPFFLFSFRFLCHHLAAEASFLDFKKNTVFMLHSRFLFIFTFHIHPPFTPAFSTFILVHHSFFFIILFCFFPFNMGDVVVGWVS